MRTRRLTAVCMAALMTLTAATGAYALACSQCHETYQGGRDNAAYGRGHHYRQARGCCHGAWRNGGGYAKDKASVYYNGVKINGADAASFKYIGRGVATDKHHTYMDGARN